MTTLILTRTQRDCLRFHIGVQVSSAVSATEYASEDRELVLESVSRAGQLLGLLDRVGWEISADEEQRVVELTDQEIDLLLSMEDEIQATFNDDYEADDGAVLDALRSLRAVA